jgi:hypothetical protein
MEIMIGYRLLGIVKTEPFLPGMQNYFGIETNIMVI